MYPVYETVAAGDLKSHTAAVFDKTKNGPVVVLSRATPRVVMIDSDEWNLLAEELRRLRLAHAGVLKERAKEIDEGKFISWEDIKSELAD